MQDDHQTSLDKQNFLRLGSISFVCLGLLICLITCMQTCNGWGTELKFSEVGSVWSFKAAIGSYLSGVVGPLFSLAGFFLLYLTFQKQKEAFLKERFESKFFEMVRLHRENVSEFDIGHIVKGRKCFIPMLNEFHYIYKLILLGAALPEYDKNSFVPDTVDKDELITDFAFKVFYFGVGYNSEKQLEHFITERQYDFFKYFLKGKLEDIQDQYLKFKKCNTGYYEYNPSLLKQKDEYTFETECYPFDGHSIRLGHYFRHLYQCVKFIDKQDNILSFNEKLFYINALRVQLSNQEQLLLYYNSLSEFGSNWHSKGYLFKYSFLKNLPLGLVRVLPHPHKKIGVKDILGKFLFEWDKIKANKLN